MRDVISSTGTKTTESKAIYREANESFNWTIQLKCLSNIMGRGRCGERRKDRVHQAN